MQLERAIALSRAKQKKCICKVVMIYAKIAFLYLFPFIVMFAIDAVFKTDDDTDYKMIEAYLIYAVLLIIYVACIYDGIADAAYEYKLFYKKVLVHTAISQAYPQLTYSPGRGISAKEFRRAGIFANSDFISEDEIKGEWDGVKFSFSEAIRIKKNYDLGIDNTYVKLASLAMSLYDAYMDFSGSVLICEFGKRFYAKTILASRELNTKILGEKELMDNVIFNSEFRVFADDKVEARYLLTPTLMERLSELKRYYYKFSISAAFMDNKFYLFLNGAPNRFETELFSIPPTTGTAYAHQYELSEILELVSELGRITGELESKI